MERVDLSKSKEWISETPKELEIPEVYINRLKLEITVLGQKKEFTFQCSGYKRLKNGAWRFAHVIIDTSKLNPKGDVELRRITYLPKIEMGEVAFMVIPIPAPENLIEA